MTVQTNTNVASFNGNGVTQIFPIAFKFNKDTDLVVLLADDAIGTSSLLTLNSDYTVSGEGDEEGGLINVVVAPAIGMRLFVSRVVDVLQMTDLRNQGKFFAEVHEDALDLLTMIAQQQQSDIARTLRVAATDPEPKRLPSAIMRAGKLFAFDADGNPTTALPVADSSTELRQEIEAGDLVTSSMVRAASGKTAEYYFSTVLYQFPFEAAADGVTDDTVAIQAAIDRTPAGGVLSGNGLTFVVRKLNVPSNIIMRDFNLITKAGAVLGEFWSPITVGGYGDTTLRENITLINIHVNGNRVLNETGVTGGEDGGKHGFRFIGRINNLRVIECSANYCGSYGFFNFVGELAGSNGTDTPLQTDVKFIGCVGRYNKAHGAAADSVDGLSYIGCFFNENGKDMPGSEGGRIGGGLYYGNGIDLEGYGIDSRLANVTIRDCDLRNNKSASLFISDPVDQQSAAFKRRSSFYIHNNLMTAGEAGSNANLVAVSITPPFANWANGYIYENIEITGGEIYGNIDIHCADKVIVDVPNHAKIGTFMGSVSHSTIRVRNKPGYLFENTAGLAPTYQYLSESTVDALGRRNWARKEMDGFLRQGVHSERIAFAAGEEKVVTIPLFRGLADTPWSVLPSLSYVSVGGLVNAPIVLSTTQNSVTLLLRNGASAQTLAIYCEVLGV